MGVRWMLILQLQRLKFQSSMVSQRLKYTATCLCRFSLLIIRNMTRVKHVPTLAFTHLKNLNRRTVDVLASRLYSYYSYAHELTNSLAEIRGTLLGLHRMATLHRDELGQETLLNLLLRNYLHYNLYDQAEKHRSKAPRFEAHSNQQFCRYLFYLGKIRTIQLEYTDAKESLLQAARKAPTAGATGSGGDGGELRRSCGKKVTLPSR